MGARYRVGVDVGGTFTDFLITDQHADTNYLLKVPSTQWSIEAIITGLQELGAHYAIDLSEILYFSHGTTLAVNTLIQRSGARVGVLITRGFRDLFELRRLRLPKANDFFVPRPVSLVPRRFVQEVGERMLSNGQAYLPVEREEVLQKAGRLVEEEVEAVAVCFLHSYRNPAHELQAKRWIEERYPGVYVCASAELWPQQREYERSLVSVMNAYIGGRMRDYVRDLEASAARLGIRCRIFAAKSNGGVMTARSAADRPIETLLSGPAMGVIGAMHVAHLAGEPRVVTLDMGGTSVDIAVVRGQVPYSTENTVGDFPVIMPAVDVVSIGAGGGSIAWTDAEGVLKVGPQSAGSIPGPMCYGHGGRRPTVTDAYVTLGLLDPDNFLGGRMKLHADLARTGMAELGERLGCTIWEAADAIVQVASSNIYAAVVPQLARAGVDSREYSLIAYGGAGPTHVLMLARSLPLRRVIIPPNPGILCALGCLAADVRADFVKSVWQDCAQLTDEALRQIYYHLEEEARAWFRSESPGFAQVYVTYSADMCYRGQSFEINVPFDGVAWSALNSSALVGWFHDRYERVYGHADRAAPARLLEARVQVVGVTEKPVLHFIAADGDLAMTPLRTRRIFDSGSFIDATVYRRSGLREGDRIVGPAIIEQYDTTTYLPRGFHATVDQWANILAEADA